MPTIVTRAALDRLRPVPDRGLRLLRRLEDVAVAQHALRIRRARLLLHAQQQGRLQPEGLSLRHRGFAPAELVGPLRHHRRARARSSRTSHAHPVESSCAEAVADRSAHRRPRARLRRPEPGGARGFHHAAGAVQHPQGEDARLDLPAGARALLRARATGACPGSACSRTASASASRKGPRPTTGTSRSGSRSTRPTTAPSRRCRRERRVSAMFSRYGVDLLRRLTAMTSVASDANLTGFSVVLSWPKPGLPPDRPVSETMALFVDKASLADFLAKRLGPAEFVEPRQALLLRRQGSPDPGQARDLGGHVQLHLQAEGLRGAERSKV